MSNTAIDAGAIAGAPDWRDAGAVLLVSCYELGRQPLGLASAAAFLARAGFAPATLDLAVEPFDPERVARARFVGISVPMHTALRLALRAVPLIRAHNPDATIALYGLYAGLQAEAIFARGAADFAIGGESEAPLTALLEALARGASTDLAGVSAPGRVAAPHLERLDYPVPARAGLPTLGRYARLERDGRFGWVGSVEASRGCKHRCRHCPIPPAYDGRFFAVPLAIVLEDVRRQVARGATHVSFADPDFLNGPTHALRVALAIHEEFPELTFDITAKIEHLLRHHALLPELAASGCLFVVSAVESFSDVVLEHLGKGHTRADVFAALRLTRAARLTLRPSLVAFTPWTTLADTVDLFDVIERETLVDHVDAVQYTIRLLVPPGSLLRDLPAMRAHLGPYDAEALGYPWRHPDPRMDALQREMSALVERETRALAEPRALFARLRELARAAAGLPPAATAPPDVDRARAPRLTEPWFC